MKSVFFFLFFFLVGHLSGQTLTADTIFFEEILPTQYDAFGCYDEVSFSPPAGQVNSYIRVVNIRMIVEGDTYGSVYADDIDLRLECLNTGISVDRQVDGPTAAGYFKEFEDNIDIANDFYWVFDVLRFRLFAKRNYQDNPGNPLCGTEEAQISKWLIIIEYHADDYDMDGYKPEADCDDFDAEINPGATERCDLLDNNCNGTIDEGGICTNIYVGLTDDWFYFKNWSLQVPPSGRHDVIIPAGKHAYIFDDLTTTYPFSVGSLLVESGGQLTIGVNFSSFLYRKYLEVEEGGVLNFGLGTIIRDEPR